MTSLVISVAKCKALTTRYAIRSTVSEERQRLGMSSDVRDMCYVYDVCDVYSVDCVSNASQWLCLMIE